MLQVTGFALEVVADNATTFLLQRTVSVVGVMLILPDAAPTLNITESSLFVQLALARKYNLTAPVKPVPILNCVTKDVESENAPAARFCGYQ